MSYLGFERYGPKYLTKHSRKFVEREQSIKLLNNRLSLKQISAQDFVEEIASLFLPERYQDFIDDTSINVEGLTDDECAAEILKAANILFVDENSSYFYKTQYNEIFPKH